MEILVNGASDRVVAGYETLDGRKARRDHDDGGPWRRA